MGLIGKESKPRSRALVVSRPLWSIASARHWYDDKQWRFRYWWLDTRSGEYGHWVCVCVFALISIIQLIRLVVVALHPPPVTVVKAMWPVWVIQLIIMVVAAAISYAMRPKPEAPKPQKGEAPTTEDGLSAKHYFGTCWVEDEFILAWKQVGTIKIKAKGGK